MIVNTVQGVSSQLSGQRGAHRMHRDKEQDDRPCPREPGASRLARFEKRDLEPSPAATDLAATADPYITCRSANRLGGAAWTAALSCPRSFPHVPVFAFPWVACPGSRARFAPARAAIERWDANPIASNSTKQVGSSLRPSTPRFPRLNLLAPALPSTPPTPAG